MTHPLGYTPSLVFWTVTIWALTFDPSWAQLQWQKLPDGGSEVPAPREDAGLGYDPVGNKLVLFGGRGAGSEATTVYDDTWIYDIQNSNSNPWRKVEGATKPGGRFSFVSGVSNDYFYVATGEGPSHMLYQDIWRFNLESETWESLPDQEKPSFYTAAEWKLRKDRVMSPEPRYGAAGGIFPNSSTFYVSLGRSNIRRADTLSYNLMEHSWFEDFPHKSPYNPSYPHARCLHAGTMISEHEFVIMGGCLSGGSTGGPCPNGDSWMFDGRTKCWTSLPACAAPRMRASMAMLPMSRAQRRVVLYGGEEESSQVITTITSTAEQVAILNPDTQTWVLRRTIGDIPEKRAGAAMATGPNGIFMFGGLGLMGKDHHLSDLYLLQGNATSADKAPHQAECHPTFFSLPILHGILMTLSWGFFLPWGPFIARYFRHKDPLWFHLHRLFQISGLLLAIGGLICGCLAVQFDHFKFAHGIAGLTVMIGGVLQPLNAIIRPKVPPPGAHKPARRVVWEFIHTCLGYSSILLGLANISLGVFLIGANHIIWILWFTYLALLVLIYAIAECRTTYKNKHKVRAMSRRPSTQKYVVNEGSTKAMSHHSGSSIEETKQSIEETPVTEGNNE